MIKDFCKTIIKKKMVSLVFFDILQQPHTVISNSEKLTHPYNLYHIYVCLYSVQCTVCIYFYISYVYY